METLAPDGVVVWRICHIACVIRFLCGTANAAVRVMWAVIQQTRERSARNRMCFTRDGSTSETASASDHESAPRTS